MKNLTKRSFALFLAIVMCLSLLNLSVFADDSNVVDIPYDCGMVEGHTHTDACYVISEEPVCGLADDSDEPETPAEEPEDSEENDPADETGTPAGETEDSEGTGTSEEGEDIDKDDVSDGDEDADKDDGSDGDETGDKDETSEEDETADEPDASAANGDDGEDEASDEGTVSAETNVTGEETGASDGENAPVAGVDTQGTLYRAAHRDARRFNETHKDAETHDHTDECYRILICELEENHVHVLGCSDAAVAFVAGVDQVMEDAEALMAEQDDMDDDEYADKFNAIVELVRATDALYAQIPAGLLEDEAVVGAREFLDMVIDVLGISLLAGDTWASVKQRLEAGTDVTLQNDIEGTDTITITKNVALDLNGHTVKFTGSISNDTLVGSVADANGNNNVGNNGSVIKVKENTFTLNDSKGTGKITGGKGVKYFAADWYFTNGIQMGTCGGGVFVGQKGKFVMNGGTITGNTASSGGGVYVARNYNGTVYGHFEMYGGSITNNTAKAVALDGGNDFSKQAHEGGGICICGEAVIKPNNGPINITSNTTNTTGDLGGGGIFVESMGSLQIYNAVITSNTAYGIGGGVAGCMHGKISTISPQTAAIYANTANGNARVADGNLVDNYDSWPNNFKNVGADYFCSGYSIVGARSMNDGDAMWSGMYRKAQTRDEKDGKITAWVDGGHTVSTTGTGAVDPIVVDGILALHVGDGNTVGTMAGKLNAYKVNISGNTSHVHGGGIGCNGKLTFGEESYAYSTTKISIEADKIVSGAVGNDGKDEIYTFQLLNERKEVISTVTRTGPGKIVFDNLMTSILFGNDTTGGVKTAILTLREVKGDTVGMDYDTIDRTITLKADRSVTDTTTITTGGTSQNITVHKFSDTLKTDGSCTITPGTLSVSGNTVTLKGDANFNNKMEYGKLSVTKVLSDDTKNANGNDTFSFTVKIGNDTYNIDLKAGKTWECPNEYPVDTQYTVTENTADGYSVVGDGTISGKIEKDGSNVTVTNKLNTVKLDLTKVVTSDKNSSKAYAGTHTFDFDVTLTYPDNTSVSDTKSVEVTGEIANTVNIAENVPVGTKFSIKEKAGSIPAGFTGVTYSYTGTVADTAQNGYAYEGTIALDATGTVTVTANNRYFETTKDASFSVKKTWDYEDGKMADGSAVVLPKTVKVQLLRDGVNYGNPVDLDDNWKAEWKNLPGYKSEGVAYTYSVKEVSVSYGAIDESNTLKADSRAEGSNIIRVRDTANVATDGSGAEIVGGWLVSDKNGTTLKNTWLTADEAIAADFSIVKLDNDLETPINGVTFTLTKNVNGIADGEGARELTTGDNGTITFTGLTQGTYTLKETNAPVEYKANGNEDRTWVITVSKGETLTNVEKVEEKDNVSGPVGNNTWGWSANDAVSNEEANKIASKWEGNGLSGTLTVYNKVIKGKISVEKVLDLDGITDDEVNGINEALKNVNFIFDIYNDKGVIVDTLKVNAGETAESDDLRYGTYTVKERQADIPQGSDLINYKWTTVELSMNDSVINDGKVFVNEQGATFEVTAVNSFERNTGDLSVTKTVTGGRGERDREWNFELTLTAPASYVDLADEYFTVSHEETVNGIVSTVVDKEGFVEFVNEPVEDVEGEDVEDVEDVKVVETVKVVDGKEVHVITFQLKHGETLKLKGLPVGTEYTVSEIEANTDGYRTTANGAEGTIEANKEAAAQFINNRPNPGTPPETPEEPPEEPEIPDPEVPLDPFDPEPDEEIELDEPDVPLASMPDIEIEDEDVPLSDVPTTGDNSGIWTILAVLSGIGLAWLVLEDRKNKNNAK